MADALNSKMAEVALNSSSTYQRTPFGKEVLKHFSFDPNWRNMNHGSYGATPFAIKRKEQEYLNICENKPDIFMRTSFFTELRKSRAAISKLLNCPPGTVAFVPNATTGLNVVLRNLVWNSDGKDEILYYKYVYGSIQRTVEYVCEASQNLVNSRGIHIKYPIEDIDLLDLFRSGIRDSRAAGKNPRVAIFDTAVSQPGVRAPYESLIQICKEEGVFSLVDGAHGVGHIFLDLSALDPDFFTSNCHKWLFVPRACAVFYVPERNQHLMRSTLPTSHNFVKTGGERTSPVQTMGENDFTTQFDYVGTLNNIAYLTIPEAIKWRQDVCGGEAAIIEYCTSLARSGGQAVAKILATEVLDNATHTLTDCPMINVRLPLTMSSIKIEGMNTVSPEHAGLVSKWMQDTMVKDYQTFIPVTLIQGQWWVRLSGQVYLESEDFEWSGRILKELCERVGKKEF